LQTIQQLAIQYAEAGRVAELRALLGHYFGREAMVPAPPICGRFSG
jgi:hypothetical protein